MTANQAEVFLRPRNQETGNKPGESQSQLDHIVAKGQVVVTQPNRKAIGDQLVYTADEDKFVLTGGPPSIFDAERGKITGVSLTFFRTGDRVVVEGSDSSPTVTHTRVAH
jgi:lipopolysaccharide export system protein LptA